MKRSGIFCPGACDGVASRSSWRQTVRKGVDKAGSDAPDIILLDMNLPIIDGWTAASMIKADGKTAHIPIIALTAHAMSGDREKAIAAGCDDYHPKPVDFSRLLAQIEALGGKVAPART